MPDPTHTETQIRLSAARMPSLQRRLTRPGPRFFAGPVVHAKGCASLGGQACDCDARPEVMFVYQLDASSSVGPRQATAEDANTYPDAWEAWLQSDRTPATAPATAAPAAKRTRAVPSGD